ncbi:hypothetical protein SAMN04515674_1094 [Pseudarcicella hirudinis]|uniref:TIGR01777 family protein n=2 Tax=Pseudarcicella hirudinis TaxID=1079859 RepID=A0A1I5V9T8_9BACT|nr:TIGR01777 family oxidoreductase [Pseudarcicella hirudinis]SFQ04288.1 hypothetical protein SAMN04515674_1094 [Pseudarcicella hirudinis]
MKIIIAGGSGFLGKCLQKYFIVKGHELIILSRRPAINTEIYWDGEHLGNWTSQLDGADALINLSGKSVDCRYTLKNRKMILDSRIKSTKVLQKAIEMTKNPPGIWLNTSSATIYVHSESTLMTEKNGVTGDDFSMDICKQWEEQFFEKVTPVVRKVTLRTSIVLGREGGAFSKMKAISLIGLGGKQGSGNQMMSWIHYLDFCRAVEFIIDHAEIKGCINLTAPNPVSNVFFMRTLRKCLHFPFGLNLPEFLLRTGAFFIRTEAELLLKSRNVYPAILLENGFEFEFPDIEDALQELT